jgi:hypothetical protein
LRIFVFVAGRNTEEQSKHREECSSSGLVHDATFHLNFATDLSGEIRRTRQPAAIRFSLPWIIEAKHPSDKYCHNAQVSECGQVVKNCDALAGRFLGEKG